MSKILPAILGIVAGFGMPIPSFGLKEPKQRGKGQFSDADSESVYLANLKRIRKQNKQSINAKKTASGFVFQQLEQGSK